MMASLEAIRPRAGVLSDMYIHPTALCIKHGYQQTYLPTYPIPTQHTYLHCYSLICQDSWKIYARRLYSLRSCDTPLSLWTLTTNKLKCQNFWRQQRLKCYFDVLISIRVIFVATCCLCYMLELLAMLAVINRTQNTCIL